MQSMTHSTPLKSTNQYLVTHLINLPIVVAGTHIDAKALNIFAHCCLDVAVAEECEAVAVPPSVRLR